MPLSPPDSTPSVPTWNSAVSFIRGRRHGSPTLRRLVASYAALAIVVVTLGAETTRAEGDEREAPLPPPTAELSPRYAYSRASSNDPQQPGDAGDRSLLAALRHANLLIAPTDEELLNVLRPKRDTASTTVGDVLPGTGEANLRTINLIDKPNGQYRRIVADYLGRTDLGSDYQVARIPVPVDLQRHLGALERLLIEELLIAGFGKPTGTGTIAAPPFLRNTPPSNVLVRLREIASTPTVDVVRVYYYPWMPPQRAIALVGVRLQESSSREVSTTTIPDLAPLAARVSALAPDLISPVATTTTRAYLKQTRLNLSHCSPSVAATTLRALGFRVLNAEEVSKLTRDSDPPNPPFVFVAPRGSQENADVPFSATPDEKVSGGDSKASNDGAHAENPATKSVSLRSLHSSTALYAVHVEGDSEAAKSQSDYIERIRLALSHTVDSRPRQVRIDAAVIEVNLNELDRRGVSFGHRRRRSQLRDFTAGALSATDVASDSTFVIDGVDDVLKSIFTGGMNLDWRGRLELFEAAGYGRVLSRPTLTTIEGRAAEISIRRSEPELTSTRKEGNTEIISAQFDRKTTGINLSVLPRVSDSGESVTIELSASVGEFDPNGTVTFEVDGASLASATPTVTRTVRTSATVRTREPLIVGGLMNVREAERKRTIPIVSEIPILGGLIGAREKIRERRELVVVLTAHTDDGRGPGRGAFHPQEAAFVENSPFLKRRSPYLPDGPLMDLDKLIKWDADREPLKPTVFPRTVRVRGSAKFKWTLDTEASHVLRDWRRAAATAAQIEPRLASHPHVRPFLDPDGVHTHALAIREIHEISKQHKFHEGVRSRLIIFDDARDSGRGTRPKPARKVFADVLEALGSPYRTLSTHLDMHRDRAVVLRFRSNGELYGVHSVVCENESDWERWMRTFNPRALDDLLSIGNGSKPAGRSSAIRRSVGTHPLIDADTVVLWAGRIVGNQDVDPHGLDSLLHSIAVSEIVSYNGGDEFLHGGNFVNGSELFVPGTLYDQPVALDLRAVRCFFAEHFYYRLSQDEIVDATRSLRALLIEPPSK